MSVLSATWAVLHYPATWMCHVPTAQSRGW